ncbi:SDR family oxidoreductase [Demetria terragena]|uniref:SDR family oxidoreductase n=1 Tax=Demetria terragena TaxID=63959 RepID=UPI00037F7BE5|nr:SDR family oxidoreductase [Demetria terragena]
MASILLIGGHGKIALLAEPLLAAAGHTVDAVIRNSDHAAEVEAAQANPVVADVENMDTATLAELVSGHDVVIWSAGAGGGNPARTYAVDRDAAIRSIDAAQAAGVSRYVMVSYFGAGPGHGVPEDTGFYHYAEAKAAADEHLRSSALDWVILGPSRLTDDSATGHVSVGPSDKSEVPRADVAAVIAAAVDTPALSRMTYEFNGGDIPVAEAVVQATR